MKIADIDTETVYWFERSSNWGEYLYSSYDRYPVKRLDDRRYGKLSSWSTNSYTPNEKGRYVRVQPMGADGVTSDGREHYVLAAQVRATYAEAQIRHEQTREHGRQLAAARARKLAEAEEKTAELKLRLSRAGIPSTLIGVKVSSSFGDPEPTILVKFLPSPDSAGALEKLLDLIEGAR